MLRRNVPMTVFLFLIMTLHATTLGCLQWPHGYLSRELAAHPLFYKFIFYLTALFVSVMHQPISRKIGLKMELAGGVLSSAAGMLLFVVHAKIYAAAWIMILSMILLGIAMLSVVNCLLTYVILVFTNKTLLGIIMLFAFGNAGLMLAPMLLRFGGYLHLTTELIFFIISLLLMYGAGILILFDEPSYSQDPSLRAYAYLRKEMPLRFPLYMLAVAFYGLIESTFSLWGEGLVGHTMTVLLSRIGASSFWLSMIAGQVIIFFMLKRFDSKKIYPFLSAGILAALIWLALTHSFTDFLVGMVVGGLSCATIFPITLFFLTKEITFYSPNDRDRYLYLIENGVSWMTAGYMFGIGLTDLVTDWLDRYSHIPFAIAIAYLAAYVGIVFYLNQTKRQEIS